MTRIFFFWLLAAGYGYGWIIEWTKYEMKSNQNKFPGSFNMLEIGEDMEKKYFPLKSDFRICFPVAWSKGSSADAHNLMK